MVIEAYVNGVVTERWDDVTRTHVRLDPEGTVVEERPYTAEENAEADVRELAETRESNASTLRQEARESLAILLASIDTLQAVTDKANNQIGPADTKAVARESRRVARQLIAITRLVIGELDSIDIGESS